MVSAATPSPSALLKLVAASGFGVCMLLMPIPADGALKIPLGVITDWVQGWGAAGLPALITAVLVFTQTGPEWTWGADIGGLVLNDLMVPAFITIALACIVLPFLTEFGLMALVAGLVERSVRRLFTVPGRSAMAA